MMINTTQELVIALTDGSIGEITMNRDCNALKGKITSLEADMILTRLNSKDKKHREVVRFITRFTILEDHVIKKHYNLLKETNNLSNVLIKSDYIFDKGLFEQICIDSHFSAHMWRYKHLDLELVKKYESYINFSILSQNIDVPEEVIRYYDKEEKIDWYCYSFKENLSKDFVTYYKDKLCLGALMISNPSLIGVLQLEDVFSCEEIHKYRELQKECKNDEKLYKQQLFAIEMLEGRRYKFHGLDKYELESIAKFNVLVNSIVEEYLHLFSKSRESLARLIEYQVFLSESLRDKIREMI